MERRYSQAGNPTQSRSAYMKTQSKLFLTLLAFLSAAAFARAGDEEMTTASVKFSNPAKPGTLKAVIPWAEVRVAGGDVAEVTVRSSLSEKNKSRRTKDGLRRIDEEVSFELVEKDNVVTLSLAGEAGWHSQGSEFAITVPRNTNLVLSTEWGGEISVSGVEGDLDINSMNGEVTLDGIASSAVVNTMNGKVNAVFKSAPVKPVSFTTMNGGINLRLPADTKASLRLRTHNGSILTDFPEDALKIKAETKVVTGDSAAPEAPAYRDAAREAAEAVRVAAEVTRAVVAEVQREVQTAIAESNGHTPRPPRAPRAPRPPSFSGFGGKSIVGTLNGGGVDVSITSMNGTITLRQSK